MVSKMPICNSVANSHAHFRVAEKRESGAHTNSEATTNHVSILKKKGGSISRNILFVLYPNGPPMILLSAVPSTQLNE